MKEFLDSTAGRTIIIAGIAAGTTVFAVPWDGPETVLRAAGGAFFGALAPLVFYLKRNHEAAQDEAIEDNEEALRFQEDIPAPVGAVVRTTFGGTITGIGYDHVTAAPPPSVTVTDFDEDYHFTDSGRHGGRQATCSLCNG